MTGGGGVIQCRPPPYPKGGATWREEIPGRRIQIQTQMFSNKYPRYWQAPTPKRQNNRCLYDRTRYYSLRYNTIYYGILGFLCAHYNVSPLNLQSHCDGCGTAFRVTHILSWSIGLVIAYNNKMREEPLYISWRAFTSASVHAKPLIQQGRIRSEI